MTVYLPVLVMIISVLRAWNLFHRSLFSSVTVTSLEAGAMAAGGLVVVLADVVTAAGGVMAVVGSSIRGPSIVRSRFLNMEPERGGCC